MTGSVEQVLLEMVDICDRLSLEYAIMGGLAVRVHGIPRPTYDVDIQVTVSATQVTEVFRAVEERGFEVATVYKSGWRDTVGGMPLVKAKCYLSGENAIDVDFFLNETAFQAAMMSRRQLVEFEDRKLWFVTPEDLILLKLLADRPRDHGDVADVIFVQGRLDEPYLQHWAKQLDITHRLVQALESTQP